MKFDLHESLVVSVGNEPPRAYYEIENGEKILLNKWKFAYFEDGKKADLSAAPTAELDVPSCWQMYGYGEKQYTNTRYPFPYRPPYILKKNPCGIYSREYEVRGKSGRYYIVFEGVDSCYYLFVNGEFAGYSTISHSPCEFDITEKLREGANALQVVVFKWCAASYLEDQDKLRFSGIFRDVYILRRPEGHVKDFSVTSDYKGKTGYIAVEADRACRFSLSYRGRELGSAEGKKARFAIENVKLWNAEAPELYDLCIECAGEIIREKAGVRKIAVKNGVILLNGKPVKFKGVNRHSLTVNAYAETEEDMKKDIAMIRAMNANAVRTSHYPPAPRFAKLCDEAGVYLLEEADLETHGTLNQLPGWHGSLFPEIVDDERFEEQIVERNLRMFARDKNRPSVLIWSLGNESGWGRGTAAAAKALKKADPSRPLHYEAAWDNDLGEYRDGGLLDMCSRMYPPVEYVKDFPENESRPLVLCEYTHAMGNSCGDARAYWQVIYGSDRLAGGFVWEWCSHSVIENGKALYGGDFGETLHDGNFCMDGIVTTDRVPNPCYYELKEVYAPADAFAENGRVRVVNRRDFLPLDDLKCVWTLETDGKETARGEYDLRGIAPRKDRFFALPKAEKRGYTYLNLSFLAGENAVARRQIALHTAYRAAGRSSAPAPQWELENGMLSSFRAGGREYLAGKTRLQIMRAPIDNDRNIVREWEEVRYPYTEFFATETEKEGESVRVKGVIAADSLRPAADVEILYTPVAGGLEISCDVRCEGQFPRFPRFGFSFDVDPALVSAEYFGRGEGESYPDRNLAAPVGLYFARADEMNYMYPKPQESGSRGGSRFIRLSDEKGGLMADSETDFSFQVTPYALEDYKAHAADMEDTGKLYLNVDYKMGGVGSNSCGPALDQKYWVERVFSFRFRLLALSAGEDSFLRHREK